MKGIRIEDGDWWTHFYGAAECYFRRTTLVSGEQDILVSTVGDWHPFNSEKAICLDRKEILFETEVFEAKPVGSSFDHGWEPDPDSPFEITPRKTICGVSIDKDSYNEANKMHESVVFAVRDIMENTNNKVVKMDSEKEKIEEHRRKVAANINQVIEELKKRAETHDASKLEPPEFEIYKRVTPEFDGKQYGTPEYIEVARKLGPALKHHYEVNRHHPEFFQNGVNGMTLIDLIEMLCDWIASAERDGGTLNFEKNKVRFDLSDQLAYILSNTYMKI